MHYTYFNKTLGFEIKSKDYKGHKMNNLNTYLELVAQGAIVGNKEQARRDFIEWMNSLTPAEQTELLEQVKLIKGK